MKLRTGLSWWLAAAAYAAVALFLIQETFSPFPLRVNGMTIVHR